MTEFKIGDWIKHKVYIKATMQINEVYKTAVHIKYNGIYDNTEVELWHPKVGEWVVIADDITPDIYAVFQFNNHSKDRQILPLAFLQTLKDQS